jgi:hypothetical protein
MTTHTQAEESVPAPLLVLVLVPVPVPVSRALDGEQLHEQATHGSFDRLSASDPFPEGPKYAIGELQSVQSRQTKEEQQLQQNVSLTESRQRHHGTNEDI